MSNVTFTADTGNQSMLERVAITQQLHSSTVSQSAAINPANISTINQLDSSQLQPDTIDLKESQKQNAAMPIASIRVSSSLGQGSSAMNLDAIAAAELYQEIEGML